MGNLNTITGTVYNAGTGASVSDNQSFVYDPLSRLTSATGPYGSVTYGYDTIGNMTSNSAVGSYSYAATVCPHAVTNAGANTYSYDNNGNLTSGAGRTLVYDNDNRPISITAGGVTTQVSYDANGARVKKMVGSNPATVYIGKLYECTGGSCTKYIFAGNERLAAVSGSAVYYYHGDHLGSTSIVTDGTQAAVETLIYQPYGGTYLNSGSASVRYKYTGKELDETGLYYYEARYYDPTLGRFVQADAIVPRSSNPQSLNRYSYVLNNPLRFIDPTGHYCQNVTNWGGATSGGCTGYGFGGTSGTTTTTTSTTNGNATSTTNGVPNNARHPKNMTPCFRVSCSGVIASSGNGSGNSTGGGIISVPVGGITMLIDTSSSSYGPGSVVYLQSSEAKFSARNVYDYYLATNNAIGWYPGIPIPGTNYNVPGANVGYFTAGEVANQVGGITPMQWILGGFQGYSSGSATFTGLEAGAIATGVSVTNIPFAFLPYQVGVAAGAALYDLSSDALSWIFESNTSIGGVIYDMTH